MDEDILLLLGLLKTQRQHGYQINEFIEKNLSRVTAMKKATAYALLARLSEAGYISVQAEQEGNRPPRKVYSITPAGEQHFNDLLQANLARADRMVFSGDIGLMFLDHLPRDTAARLLLERRDQIDRQIAIYTNVPRHDDALGVDLAMERILVLLRADRDWLTGLVERLER